MADTVMEFLIWSAYTVFMIWALCFVCGVIGNAAQETGTTVEKLEEDK